MKDDTSTPTPEGLSPNEFERSKPGTTARSDAEAAIEELRQRGGIFVEAVRATRMPMALTDPNLFGNPIVFANEAFLKLSGYRMEELLGQQPHFMNGPDTDPKDAARFAEALRSDQDDIIETVQYRKNGSRFVATVLMSAFKDRDGRVLNHFMSWLDVTRRVDAEDELAELKKAQAALRESERRSQVLLGELQHRVRNTLAVVRSIARRTAENTHSSEDMLGHFQGRLDAFSRVQSVLTRSPDAKIDLASLIDDELVAHAAREGEQVQTNGPTITLAARSAEWLSLAIHELTTNAVKHGALMSEHGQIRIDWDRRAGVTRDELLLTWQESGLDLSGREPNPDGFGMHLLRTSLAYDVDGETRVDLQPTGIRFELRMPIEQQGPPTI